MFAVLFCLLLPVVLLGVTAQVGVWRFHVAGAYFSAGRDDNSLGANRCAMIEVPYWPYDVPRPPPAKIFALGPFWWGIESRTKVAYDGGWGVPGFTRSRNSGR